MSIEMRALEVHALAATLRDTAAAVSGALGTAVAAHIPLVAAALERAADGTVGPRDGDALRGLGYLTLDEGAARAVENGLQGWADAGAGGPAQPGGPGQLLAVPSAFVAVREYGQRLAYALHGFEQQAAAELRERRWDWTVGLLAEALKGPVGTGPASWRSTAPWRSTTTAPGRTAPTGDGSWTGATPSVPSSARVAPGGERPCRDSRGRAGRRRLRGRARRAGTREAAGFAPPGTGQVR